MSEGENVVSPLTPSQRRSNQIKLLILWLVPFGLMAIAGSVYYFVYTGKITLASKNNGDLLVPAVQMKDVFETADNDELRDIWDGKWTIALRVIGRCDEKCMDDLYLTRQLHIRLDKEANRVQRVLLLDRAVVDDEFKSLLDTEHSLLKVVELGNMRGKASLNAFDQKLQQTVAATRTDAVDGAPELSFFLVDQAGFAMMTYHQGHEGNLILQDLKHLLKFSRKR